MFLDSSIELPLFVASKQGSLKLLERIWNSSKIFETEMTDSEAKWTLRRFLRTDKHYRQYVFSKVMEDAISRQDLEMIRWLSSKFQGCTVPSEEVAKACEAGTMDILQFFYDNDSRVLEERRIIGRGHPTEWGGLTMSAAIKGRRSDIVWWLHRHIPDADFDLDTAFEFALKMGEIVMAEWLVAHGADSSALNVAIWTVVGNGRLDVLKWLVERWRLESIILVLPKAVQKGHMNIVRWMVNWSQRSYPQDDHRRVGIATLAIHTAVVYGHLEIAKYLHKFVTVARQSVLHSREQLETIRRGIAQVFPEARIVSWRTITRAAEKGFLDTVRWLYEKYGSDPDINIFEYTESHKRWFNDTIAMDVAAAYGHLDVLKFFHELQTSGDKRLVCTWRAMDRASANGYLNVVQWLHENRGEGCSSKAIDKAASSGRLDVVLWLHEHRTEGCTHAAMDGAAMDGHLEVVQWLHVNRSEGCTKAAMECAAINGHLDVVKWLHANRSGGCNHAAMDEAAGNGFLDVVKWLHVNRSEGCTGRAMDGASGSGDLKVVQWLYANHSEGCSPDVLDFGVTGNFFEVVLFLHDHYHLECTESALQLHEHNYNYKCLRAWMLELYPAFRDVVPHE